MNNKELFEIRCPQTVKTKNGYEIQCNHLCCIADRGSLIRIMCRHCKTLFEAYIPDNAHTTRDIGYRILK